MIEQLLLELLARLLPWAIERAWKKRGCIAACVICNDGLGPQWFRRYLPALCEHCEQGIKELTK